LPPDGDRHFTESAAATNLASASLNLREEISALAILNAPKNC
jgi:hypothetical protein